MDGLGFLVSIATFVMVLFAFNKSARLDTKIAQLKLQLGQLADDIAKLRGGVVEAPDVEAVAVAAAAVEAVAEPVIEKAPPPEPEVAKPQLPKRDMEQAVASRWFVWIGGVAVAIGGLLFVKYAYDNGLISPSLQVLLGLLMAAGFILAGDLLRRKSVDGDYVPAALSAAGLAIAFASIYAAYALYELVGPTADFVGLSIVGLGGLALSLRQGPLIAALGLVGSYVTPMLISSPDPSAWGFFPYLIVILGASFAVLHKRTWWWLGYAAVAGSTLWSFLWLAGPMQSADVVPFGLFALALGGISLFAISGRGILASETGSLLNPTGMTVPLKIGTAGVIAAALVLAALVIERQHFNMALVFFFIGMACISLLSWFKKGSTGAALAAATLSFLVLMAWWQASFIEWAMDERGFWTSLLGGQAPPFLNWMLAAGTAFTALGLIGVLKKEPPVTWAILASAAAILFLCGAWARVDGLLGDHIWALLAAIPAAALLGTVWSLRSQLADDNSNLASGILCIGAAGLLLFTEDRMLNGVWLTIAIAALATAYAFSTHALAIRLLAPTAAALGSLTTLRLFVSRELWNDDRTLPLGQHWPLYGYGIPVVLFYMASRWLKSSGHARSSTAFEALSLGLVISLVSLELRVLISGGIGSDEPQLLEMAAHVLTWLGAAYGLIYRQQIFSSFISIWGARVLIAASVAAIVSVSLGVLNPVVTEDPVPGSIVFNALLLAYLAPVVLLGLIARGLGSIQWEKLRPAFGGLALVLALSYVTLETKRVFQGPNMVAWSISTAESYAYSAVWLASAFALFVAGIRLERQYIRYAGLGVMALVVLKVFLWDMSGLDGIYRILSFMGLGLCLIGMGWIYTKFVQKPVRI
jgi:uncharacterized membrane protein